MNQQYSPTGFSLLPPVVKNLLIINGLFFLATFSLARFGIDLEKMFGLYYIKSPEFQPYQFVTYMFIHANLAHIFFNLLALWMFGRDVEYELGPYDFLKLYLLGGIIGGLVYRYLLEVPESQRDQVEGPGEATEVASA